MGNSTSTSSNSKKRYEIYNESLKEQAKKNYKQRIENYNYSYHGDYDYYIYECQAIYELECIPENCRSGGGRRGGNIWG